MPKRIPEPRWKPDFGAHPIDIITGSDNAYGEMMQQRWRVRDVDWCMHLGRTGTHWMVTSPQGHALAIAPPRSAGGKTSSVIIPEIIFAGGPVVSTSTKPDVVRATAVARAPFGRVWCYAPDGSTPIPPGLTQLRWSPLSGAEDWGVAIRTATSMTKTLSTVSLEGGDHWKDRATDLLAPVFHWAALRGLPMRQARDAVAGLLAPVSMEGKRQPFGWTIRKELQRLGADRAAVAVLGNIMSTPDREVGSIISAAMRALQVYQLPGAIASTEQPNFDPAEFVKGGYGGGYGAKSTVYILSSNEDQEITAPLVVAFLGQIRQAAYSLHREDQRARMSGADMPNSPPPTVFALDEMYGIAPIPDLANMLSEGGSQGVLVMGAVQDLALVKDRWKTAGDSFLTLFGDVLVFPGIRHRETLEAVSTLFGDRDRSIATQSVAQGPQGITYTEGEHWQREHLVPPDRVAAGVGPDPRWVLHLSSRGMGQLIVTPYWWDAPWPHVLTRCMEHSLEHPQFGNPPLTSLPIPDLSAWAQQSRDPWAARYLAAVERWGRLSRRWAPPVLGLPDHPGGEHPASPEEQQEDPHDAPIGEGDQRGNPQEHADGHVPRAARPHWVDRLRSVRRLERGRWRLVRVGWQRHRSHAVRVNRIGHLRAPPRRTCVARTVG
jgi:type IV secretion system protein VirD4